MNVIKYFEETCNLLNINTTQIDYKSALNNKKIYRSEIDNNGFVIIKKLIDEDLIQNLKNKWNLILNNKYSNNFNLMYGQEKNYTKFFFKKYKRHFDFYWNKPTDKKTRDLSLQLHVLRNIINDINPLHGLILNEDKVGIYLAITNYPVDSGEMNIHVDPNSFLPIHYNLPLTFKGYDYLEGGLKIKSKSGLVDIDELMTPGDLLMFNGGVPHLVETIKGQGKKSNLGRIQMFAVPDDFSKYKNISYFRKIFFEYYGRIRYSLSKRNILQKKTFKNFR